MLNKQGCPVCGQMLDNIQEQCSTCGHCREFHTTPDGDMRYQLRIEYEKATWYKSLAVNRNEDIERRMKTEQIIAILKSILIGKAQQRVQVERIIHVLKLILAAKAQQHIQADHVRQETSEPAREDCQIIIAEQLKNDPKEVSWLSFYLTHMVRRTDLERILAEESERK